jgi:CheY-specific phosphatase CheX
MKLEDWFESLRTDGSISEYISSIMLWGGPGRVMIKAHFDLETAVSWAAHGLQMPESEVDDSIAIDFFREFCNLHAGYLRGVLEANGLLFGISLPFIMAGDSEGMFQELQGNSVETCAWRLVDGNFSIICTAEIEIIDSKALELVRPSLEALLLAEDMKRASSADDGNVEFLF